MKRTNDLYQKSFKGLNEALEEFELFKSNSEAFPVRCEDITVVRADVTTEAPVGVLPEVWKDTQENSRIAVSTPYGIIPVRECAVPHLLDRAGYSCEVAAKKRSEFPEEFVTDTTRNLEVMGGSMVVYKSFEKVTAFGSSVFSPMEPFDLANILITSLAARSGASPEFVEGNITHEFASLSLVLDDPNITAAYEKEVNAHECDERELVPFVHLVTSNTKASGAELRGGFMNRNNGVLLPIGVLSSVIHKGKPESRLIAFENNCDALFSRFREIEKRLTALLDIELDYPLSVFLKAGKKIGLCRPSIAPAFTRAYNAYVSTWGASPTNAHEVYWGMAETIAYLKEANAPTSVVLTAEELLLEMLAPRFSWDSFDVKVLASETA